jgi:hypothetical protein
MPHPGFKFVEAADRRALVAPGLRLTFARLGQRWTHALAVGAGSAFVVNGVACAVEGDIDGGDPSRVVSPAYQEIEPHPCEAGLRALLTGQSATHHFSAVVTVRRDGDGTAVDLDVADRCRSPVEVLAGTYLVQLGSSDLLDAGPERVVWGGDALGRGRLEFSTVAPNTIALAEAGRRATRVQALARIVPTTFTQRLAYQWRWTPASEYSFIEDLLGVRD